MTINHLNLTVPDPLETSAFLARHFDLRAGGGNAGMQVLHDDHGMVLTLIKARREDLERQRRLRAERSLRRRSATRAASISASSSRAATA